MSEYMEKKPRGHGQKGIFVFFFLLCMAFRFYAMADEADAGETRLTARRIGTNTLISERTEDGGDIDVFRFETTVTGFFEVTLKNHAVEGYEVGEGWDFSVTDADATTLTTVYAVKNEAQTTIKLPYAKAGRTFYVEVTPAFRSGPEGCTYDLIVSETAATDWESEPNQTKAAANLIRTNTTYHGSSQGDADEDWFRFRTSVSGYLEVRFGQNGADTADVSDGWEIRVLDADGNVIAVESAIRATVRTTVKLPYAKAGAGFFIEVTPDAWNTPVGAVYDLMVSEIAAAYWESEPNQTRATATDATTGKTYHGNTLGQDEDWYKLKLPTAGVLNVSLRCADVNVYDVNVGWDVGIYEKTGDELDRMSQVRTKGAVDVTVKKGAVYIKVEPSGSWNMPDQCQYDLSFAFERTPSKPKILSVKSSEKTAVVKWKKVSGATGYYVYRSTKKDKGYKRLKTIQKSSTLTLRNKKLKSKKTYYYKIKAFKKVRETVLVSPSSSAKSVTIR